MDCFSRSVPIWLHPSYIQTSYTEQLQTVHGKPGKAAVVGGRGRAIRGWVLRLGEVRRKLGQGPEFRVEDLTAQGAQLLGGARRGGAWVRWSLELVRRVVVFG